MVNTRYVKANGSVYLRKEDMIEYLCAIADGEETDTRNRLYDAALKIKEIGND